MLHNSTGDHSFDDRPISIPSGSRRSFNQSPNRSRSDGISVSWTNKVRATCETTANNAAARRVTETAFGVRSDRRVIGLAFCPIANGISPIPAVDVRLEYAAVRPFCGHAEFVHRPDLPKGTTQRRPRYVDAANYRSHAQATGANVSAGLKNPVNRASPDSYSISCRRRLSNRQRGRHQKSVPHATSMFVTLASTASNSECAASHPGETNRAAPGSSEAISPNGVSSRSNNASQTNRDSTTTRPIACRYVASVASSAEYGSGTFNSMPRLRRSITVW